MRQLALLASASPSGRSIIFKLPQEIYTTLAKTGAPARQVTRHSYMNGAPPATLPGARIAHTDEWGRSQHSLSTATFLADENYGVRTGHGRNWVSPGPTLQKGTARTSGAFSSICQATPRDEFNLAAFCSCGETFRQPPASLR